MTTIRTITSSDIQNLFSRTAVGAERYLEDFFVSKNAPNYPPYNIEALSADDYKITIAVAGFAREEIEVSIDNGHLNVSGGYQETPATEEDGVDESKYPVMIHQGIAKRNFKRSFKLMDYVVVTNVSLKDGLLVINLMRELPEALKPRIIEIG